VSAKNNILSLFSHILCPYQSSIKSDCISIEIPFTNIELHLYHDKTDMSTTSNTGRKGDGKYADMILMYRFVEN
jgi:hypothetical protein